MKEFDQSVKCFNAVLPAGAGKVNFETMVFFSPTPIYKMVRCISKDKAVVSIQTLVPNLPGEHPCFSHYKGPGWSALAIT